ncbi:hypothetical protein V6B08_07270 [Ferrovibrio sp. MS7]|jgi:hypothetical protein|uniref:hypothetical protein n=1 Tax=Ferrovibrio plantarum TaxID=3119164 RepID=UPI003135D616
MSDDLIDPTPFFGGLYSDLYMPLYRSLRSGPWRLHVIRMVACRGYWGDVKPLGGSVVLTRDGPDGGRESWMSLTPTEIESQEIGLRAARGHTVVFGLGMGWLAANAALRSEVSRVTVVERDGDVIAAVRAAGVLELLPEPARAKLTLVQADALTWRPDAPVDSLQADIWLRYSAPQRIDEARRMQANVAATEIYCWGQEIDIWRYACRRAGHDRPALDWPLLRTIVAEDIRLPLILPDWPDYPARITAAAQWWTPKEPGWWQ